MKMLNVNPLEAALKKFSDDRNWAQFHTPKNLVMALTGEVGELNEIFQWISEAEAWNVAKDESTAINLRDELADVVIYLVRLASVLEVDLDDAVDKKLKKNAQKYPPNLRT